MSTQNPDPCPRRGFIKTLGGLAVGLSALPSLAASAGSAPARRAGSKYMGGFAAPKLEKVKCAIIGVGARGSGHAGQLSVIEGMDIVGICDLDDGLARNRGQRSRPRAMSRKFTAGMTTPGARCSRNPAGRRLHRHPWELHAPQCVGAMKAGAHAFCRSADRPDPPGNVGHRGHVRGHRPPLHDDGKRQLRPRGTCFISTWSARECSASCSTARPPTSTNSAAR